MVVGFAAIVLALASGDEVSYGSFLLVYAKYNLKMTEANGQYVTSVYWGSFTLGRLIAIPLATLMSNQSMLMLELSLTMVTAIFLLMFNKLATSLWIGTFLFGLGIAILPLFGVNIEILHLVYAAIGVLIFSVYLIYDTQVEESSKTFEILIIFFSFNILNIS